MKEWQERTALQYGEDGLRKLQQARVCIIGLGGVGGYAAEMIARAGVGEMIILDADSVSTSNINRQLIALQTTIGQSKIKLFKERLLAINPALKLTALETFLDEEVLTKDLSQHLTRGTYVIDAIDTIQPKVDLIKYCLRHKLKIISSMGGGGKTDLEKLTITDISKTKSCRLAATVRKRLKQDGIYKGLKVVFSPEHVSSEKVQKVEGERNKKTTVGTVSYFPPVMGCYLASWVINKIVN